MPFRRYTWFRSTACERNKPYSECSSCVERRRHQLRHQNLEEVKAVALIAEHLQEQGVSYRILTPYDAQRNALERALKEKELNWHDKCFNVDSFQGSF